MAESKYIGMVVDGKLSLSDTTKNTLANDITRLEGEKLELFIKIMNKRTTPQNMYFFGVVVPEIHKYLISIGNDITNEGVHSFLKSKFNYGIVCNNDGEVIGSYEKSTKPMSKDEFSNYIDTVIKYAENELKIEIPKPINF
jgi:hypothetical protein